MSAIQLSGKAIPYEIFFLITSHLPRSDWKTLRLLCQEFNALVTEFPFFEELWFSAHAEDLEVFQGVCAHPVWAKQVKTILYDTIIFDDRTLNYHISNNFKVDKSQPEYEKIKETEPGFRAYVQHAEATASEDVQLDILTKGLRKLPNLSHFHISPQFGNETVYLRDRSPLTRSWRFGWPEPDWGYEISPGIVRLIFSAIINSNTSIVEFTTQVWKESCVEKACIWGPTETFTFQRPLLRSVQTFFGNLTNLNLNLRGDYMSGKKQYIAFAKLLRSACKLEKLSLDFDDYPSKGKRFFGPSPRIPSIKKRVDLETLVRDTTFPHLQSLKLKGLYTTAKSVEEFLSRHRKSLRELSLEICYLPSAEKIGFSGLSTGSVDEKSRFVGFLNELEKGLEDGMELRRTKYADWGEYENVKRHFDARIYLADFGERGWTLDTQLLDPAPS